jgi:hypothetical protein
MGRVFKDDAEKERWRRGGGFVPGDLVCWYDQRWGGVHRVGSVRLIGDKPEHQVSVEWAGVEGLTEAQRADATLPYLAGISPRIYPHVMRLVTDCLSECHPRPQP